MFLISISHSLSLSLSVSLSLCLCIPFLCMSLSLTLMSLPVFCSSLTQLVFLDLTMYVFPFFFLSLSQHALFYPYFLQLFLPVSIFSSSSLYFRFFFLVIFYFYVVVSYSMGNEASRNKQQRCLYSESIHSTTIERKSVCVCV